MCNAQACMVCWFINGSYFKCTLKVPFLSSFIIKASIVMLNMHSLYDTTYLHMYNYIYVVQFCELCIIFPMFAFSSVHNVN